MNGIRLVTPDMGALSSNPTQEAEEQARYQRAQQRYEEILARRPLVEARLTTLEREWLPSLTAAVEHAAGAVEAARWGFFFARVGEQGGAALAVDGRAAIALDPGEEDTDPAVLAARAEHRRLKDGLRRLHEQRAALRDELREVANGPPHRADRPVVEGERPPGYVFGGGR